jgi:hypothetical protein
MSAPVKNTSRLRGKGFGVMSPVLLGALLAGVLLHLAGFLVFRVVSNPLPTRDDRPAFVRYISASSIAGDLVFEEQAQLFDSAPLFIPTQWNAAQSVSLMSGDRIRERFPEFEPEINLVDELHVSSLPLGEAYPVSVPADLLKSRFWSFFAEFGQAQGEAVSYPSVGHFAEVMLIGGGAPKLALECTLEFTDTSAVPEPVTMFVRVSNRGLYLGEPVVSQSSGNVAFDRAAKAWLRLPETISQFPEGYLLVKVYP